MDTAEKINAAFLAQAKKLGYKVSKIKKKIKSDKAIVVASTVAPVAKAMFKDPEIKNITLRKIFLKTIKTKYFNDVLDAYFKGAAREAFDSIKTKEYNYSSTFIGDIKKAGLYKRFKLVERYCIWDLEALRAMFEEGYYPKKVVVKKRKYKYKKASSRK